MFINNPGNLTNLARRDRLELMVTTLESLPYAYKSKESSMYFMRDFELFESLQNNEEETDNANGIVLKNSINDERVRPITIDIANDLKAFLEWPEYEQWNSFVKFHDEKIHPEKNSSNLMTNNLLTTINADKNLTELVNKDKKSTITILDGFFLTVAYHGDDLKDW